MKRVLFGALLGALAFSGCVCTTVEAGYVGVRVELYGDEKGTANVVGPGRYYIGPSERIYEFPVFEQNPKYTKAVENDAGREVEFQSQEGMPVDADFAVTYTIARGDVLTLFGKYRRDIDEINSGPLRNILRDAVNKTARNMPVESLYGSGATVMLEETERLVRAETSSIGITVTRVALLSPVRLPESMARALNLKVEATQRAQQRENELREAEAEARKAKAQADGQAAIQVALANGRATSLLVEAEAQAKANQIIARSITPELIQYRHVDKWDGRLSQVSGTGGTLVDLRKAP